MGTAGGVELIGSGQFELYSTMPPMSRNALPTDPERDFCRSFSLRHALKDIARERRESLSHLIANIDQDRQFANLSSAIRLFVLGFYRDQFARQLSMAEQREITLPVGLQSPTAADLRANSKSKASAP